jgi:leucine dehydrogenase
MPHFAGHELVTSRQELSAGLAAMIAIHNSNLGPAIGGCRIRPYPSVDEAVTDVLRLSRAMTYKSAIARIPYGGGKAVIIADPSTHKTQALLHAMGEFVDSLEGRYITSFDSGITLDDVRTMGERTKYTAGTLEDVGNASASTAYGVYQCLRVAARARLGRDELEGLHVAIQGVGSVGRRLAALLWAEGVALTIADTNPDLVTEVAEEFDARTVDCDRIYHTEADAFLPCAIGGVLSAGTIGQLRAKIVVGGASCQLATEEDDRRLFEAGILYCPDYLANAGGIIDLHYQRIGWSCVTVERHIEGLAETFLDVIERSLREGAGTGYSADRLAEERFSSGRVT